jgi:serine/threonine protein kinase
MKKKLNNNFLNQFSLKNRTHEQISNDSKNNKKMKQTNKGNNSLFLNKIDSINNKKKINLNKISNLNELTKNNSAYEVNYHTTKNVNFNKKLNYYIKQKLNKQEESNYTLDKTQGNCSVPLIKNSFKKYNNLMNKNKKNIKNTNFSYLANNDIYDNTTNSSAYRIINTNSIDNRYLLNFKNNNYSNENYDKFNSKNNDIDNDDNDNLMKNLNIDKIDIHKKKIIDFNNLNKSVNFNQNYNEDKIRNKMNNVLFKGQKEIDTLKKKFLNHFSIETNTKHFNKNNISLQNTTKLGKKNKINYNFKPKKQKSKYFQNIDTSAMNNNSLSELINKFRQNKKNVNKTSINSNNNSNSNFKKKLVNKKVIAKKKILNNQYNYNQSSSLNNIKKYQKNSKKLPKLSDLITKTTDNNNEYMEQSLKLSEYIKDFYLKYYNYPQTNLNFYKIGRLIGQGGFAKVNLGLNVLTGRVVAIKSFNKAKKTKYGDNLNMDKILYEINLMRKLNHPNITKILETFEDEKFYFIIMEYINGGNLFSYVKKRRKLSEKVAKFLFRQIILGIKHIHSQLIVHRDIKLENILIDMNNKVKICDFGIGIILSSEDQELHSHCGTPMYIAPEIILSTKDKGYKGFPVDIWSAGIALYIMLSGKLPFNLDDDFQDDFVGYNNDNIKEKNKKLKYEIVHNEPKYIEKISDEARNLLNGLLNKNPLKRLTCDQILNHPWFSDVNNNKNHLFSKSEKALLSKTYIDYRKNKLEDLIENFTLSNLFNDKKNTDIEKNNCETKSSLLAPFNSLNINYFISDMDIDIQNIKFNDEFDDSNNKNILVEKNLIQYSIKAKEFNFQYELNNNKEVDNGVLINSKSFACSSSSSFSNANTNRNEIENGYKGLEYISKDKIEEILNQIECMGYDRDYVLRSVKHNLLNHASTIFFLLIQYENI